MTVFNIAISLVLSLSLAAPVLAQNPLEDDPRGIASPNADAGLPPPSLIPRPPGGPPPACAKQDIEVVSPREDADVDRSFDLEVKVGVPSLPLQVQVDGRPYVDRAVADKQFNGAVQTYMSDKDGNFRIVLDLRGSEATITVGTAAGKKVGVDAGERVIRVISLDPQCAKVGEVRVNLAKAENEEAQAKSDDARPRVAAVWWVVIATGIGMLLLVLLELLSIRYKRKHGGKQ